MLIIAIPKSASTSLMITLSRLHHLPREQDTSLRGNSISNESVVLHNFHSDVRELEKQDVAKFANQKKIYKQHIFPSKNNIELLKEVKKVVLLREPEEVVLAYKRGMKKKVHNQLKGLNANLSDTDFLNASKEIGLFKDLEEFYSEWKNVSCNKAEKVKIVYYTDLINSPQKVINEIEKFFDIEVHEGEIILSKERYTRRNNAVNLLYLIVLKLRKIFNLLKIS